MATYDQVRYGSRGDAVYKLQEMLNENGYNLDKDGVFGAKTQAAVKDYQKKNGLAVDGIAGNKTFASLTGSNNSTLNTVAAGVGKAAGTAGGGTPDYTSVPTTATASYAPNTLADNDVAAGEPTTPTTPETAPATTGGFNYGEFTYDSFTPSDIVNQANALLQQQQANKPGAYTPVWQDEAEAYLSQYQNRDPFSYDFNSDALYNQYKDNYIRQGQMAMMDTMGQAAAMTGGYGNSYAQSVGQQAYQQQLSQLNNILPDLWQMAHDRYTQEGNELLAMYDMYMDKENLEYGRYQDNLSNWYTEMARLQDNYNTLYNREYGEYEAGKNLAYNEYNAGRETAWQEYLANQEKEQAAAELMASTGYYDRLGDVYGLTEEEIAAIKEANEPKYRGPSGPNYKALSLDQINTLSGIFKKMDASEASMMAELYASQLGADPNVVKGIATQATGGLLTGQPGDTTVFDTSVVSDVIGNIGKLGALGVLGRI